tara:strand:- start:283 stop:603 length:321 start_codon:yes stop_codon:yes gene_type:complete
MSTYTQADHDRLLELIKKYPQLTFENDGYKYLPEKVVKAHAEPIEEISVLLRKWNPVFVEFNNFKKSGTVRYQGYWSPHFIGVCYDRLADMNPANIQDPEVTDGTL